MSKKPSLCLIMLVLLIPSILNAQTISLELNANTTDVEGKAEARLQGYEADISIGGGIIFSKDDNLISNLTFSLKDPR